MNRFQRLRLMVFLYQMGFIPKTSVDRLPYFAFESSIVGGCHILLWFYIGLFIFPFVCLLSGSVDRIVNSFLITIAGQSYLFVLLLLQANSLHMFLKSKGRVVIAEELLTNSDPNQRFLGVMLAESFSYKEKIEEIKKERDRKIAEEEKLYRIYS